MQATGTDTTEVAGPIGLHLRQTVGIALPIAAALLSEMGMGLISTTMLGGLGDRALAAGALATNVFFTVLLVLQGMLSGVGVLAANRLGAGQPEEVPALYWSGVALALGLAMPMVALLSLPAGAWTALGLAPGLAHDVADYLRILRWAVPGGMVGVGMMRQFLPAIGLERVLLWVLPGGVVLHAGLTRWLIEGGAGLPAFGLAGSAAAIVATLSILAVGMLAVLHGKRFGGSVRWVWPSWGVIRPLLGIGLPVAAMVAVEAGLFLVTGVVAGVLGPSVLAAHMIALSVASVSFMVPLAVSQAANVRVASAHGAGNLAAARRAGFCAIGLSLAFMASTALILSTAPGMIVRLYLSPASGALAAGASAAGASAAGAATTAALAARLLRVAGVFQLADGTQVAAAGALRGLQDVRVPTLLATFGYWGLGFWAGLWLAFREQLGVVGLWWGLCVGLAVVAVCLTARFAQLCAPPDGPGAYRTSSATSLRLRKGMAKGGS